MILRRIIKTKSILLITGFLVNNILFSQNAMIRGKVTYGTEVLEAATVTLGSQVKHTDANGEFLFSVSPATYTIVITYAGYNKMQRTIKAEAGRTIELEFNLVPGDKMEEVTIGSRSKVVRSNINTTVPVDIFTSSKLEQTGHLGLLQSLIYLAPSLNTGKQEFNESVTQRGLGPDHLLILVNGTRYHNAAILNTGTPKSSIGRGSVYNDLNSIPLSAIEKVELLRDGATAQYGSDGIAGVLNIVLKKQAGKSSFQLHNGQYYPGDGEKLWLGGYHGFTLNKKGFLSLAADIRYQGPTTRAAPYLGTAFYTIPAGTSYQDSIRIKAQDDSVILARGIDKKTFSKHNGINRVINAGFMVNGGIPIHNRSKFTWTSLINYKNNQAPGSYRYFKDSRQVNTEIYPDGFRPLTKIRDWDFSLLAGFETETAKRWNVKLNSSFGSNSNNTFVYNSNNASQQFTLGKHAPTDFFLGQLIYKIFLNNFTLSKDFAGEKRNLKTCNLALGAEWRLENYQQRAGDEESWKNYDPRKTGGAQPSVGSVNPDNVVNKNRTVAAVYADFELEPGSRLLLDLATRFEYYSDFGGNLAGKISARYKISENFSFRLSVSNGFRAPSIQQRFFEGTQSFRGTAQTSGIFNNNSPVTKVFGIPSLQAERSIHFSGGFTSKLSDNINLTVDAYLIQIKNRIVLSGVFDTTNHDIAAILVNYPQVDFVQFFSNAINTRTQGIDAMFHGKWRINKSSLELTMAASFNRNSIFGKIKTTASVTDTSRYTNTLFGVEERTSLEKDQPGEKIILSGIFSTGRFGFSIRNSLFGKTATTTIINNPRDTLNEYYSSKILTDVSIRYAPNSWLTVRAGANNIFNIYPDQRRNYQFIGQGISMYSNGATPFGSNGGYYFLHLAFNFAGNKKTKT